MDVESPAHEERISKLEQKVEDLACEVKLLREHIDKRIAEVRAEMVTAIAESEARMRAYIDARLAPIEQTLRWVIGLLITVLLGMIGLASTLGSIMARLP